VQTKTSHQVSLAGHRNAGILTIAVVSLTLFGLVMVLSASSVTSLYDSESPYSLFQRQAMWAAVGGVAFVIGSRVDYRWLRPLAVPFLVVTVLLLIAVLIPGVGRRINGSSRWLGVGPFVVQPGEFAKLAIVLFTADLLSRRSKQMHRSDITIKPVMLIVGLLSALLLLQPKLGTTIVIAAVGILMLFVAGARLPHLFAWSLFGAVAASVAAFSSDYRRARLLSFRDPWADPLGDGLQTIQSWIGIASGGWLGVGLGAGRAKWGFLPYAHSDFIFAIVAEELGLLGAGALVAAFALIGYLGIRAALNAPDRFGMLLAAGLTTWLLVQAFMNIAMSVGLMPITGEPLPFVSAGGSSLVTTLGAAGVLTNIARRAKA
jgi:cell division protein FtsW